MHTSARVLQSKPATHHACVCSVQAISVSLDVQKVLLQLTSREGVATLKEATKTKTPTR